MGRTKNWLKNEFVIGYSNFERIFLAGMLALQIVIFFTTPTDLISIIAGLSGVISVVLCAKGKVSFYFIGFVQTISYLILSWQNRFYGEVIENIFYLVTMVIGIFLWQKNAATDDSGAHYVKTKKMTALQWVLAGVATIILSIARGYGLTLINSQQAYTDAATNVIAIFAQLLMIKRYREQWVWWLVLNLICIKMWFVAGNAAMVAMYVAWTANCIYGWFNWTKLNRVQEKEKEEIREAA